MRLQISFNEEDRTLYGSLTLDQTESEPITPAYIRQQLEHAGYANMVVNPQAEMKLCAAAQKGEELTLPLKMLVDATLDIAVAVDKKSATLTLTEADGGKEISLDDAKYHIQEAGLDADRVDWPLVESIIERGYANTTCIATADLPENGKDAVYTPLVESEVNQTPVVDDQGVADMLSGHSFTLVDQGDALMRREPATPGEPGLDVTGASIPPLAGKDPGFSKHIEGAEIAADDEHLLIASIKGHPILLDNGVSVDPVLHVDNVDIHTGNIEFDGSLEVRGDVAPGLTIKVSGDVMVKGAVERAEIIAGNHIVVQGGIFGDEEFLDAVTEDGERQQHFPIKSKGNIEAGFLYLVAVKAEQDVIVKQYIGNCLVEAGNQLLVGKGGGKGICFGGFLTANRFAEIVQLGNSTYIETHLRVGRLDQLQSQRQQIEAEIKARRHELNQLQVIFDKISKKDPTMLGKVSVDKSKRIANTVAAIKETVQQKQKQLDAVLKVMEQHKQAKLVIGKKAYPNITININGAVKRFNEEYSGDTWQQHNGQIFASSEKDD